MNLKIALGVWKPICIQLCLHMGKQVDRKCLPVAGTFPLAEYSQFLGADPWRVGSLLCQAHGPWWDRAFLASQHLQWPAELYFTSVQLKPRACQSLSKVFCGIRPAMSQWSWNKSIGPWAARNRGLWPPEYLFNCFTTCEAGIWLFSISHSFQSCSPAFQSQVSQ